MKFIQNNQKGFTLVELLVVIAIIGILSAVVLTSLSTARNKGNDAAVKQNLHSVQSQAEIYYMSNSNTYGSVGYGTACTSGMYSDATIAKAITGVKTANSSTAVYCYASGNSYLIAATLATSGTYWCIDSTGTAKEETGSVPTTAPTNNVCP